MNRMHAHPIPHAHLPLPDTRQPIDRWSRIAYRIAEFAVLVACLGVLGYAILVKGVPA